MQQQLLKMLELQDAMNTKVHADWRDQGYAWYRAIWVECAELMEHYGWKWWKQQVPDAEQVVLELVDIWHFGLSDLLQQTDDNTVLVAKLEEALAATHQNVGHFRVEVESFVQSILTERAFNVAAFCRVMASANLSFERLYLQYMGKNVLNFFRQDNGYKDGSYRKLWQGREDNEHLVEVLEAANIESPSFQHDIYAALQARYDAAG